MLQGTWNWNHFLALLVMTLVLQSYQWVFFKSHFTPISRLPLKIFVLDSVVYLRDCTCWALLGPWWVDPHLLDPLWRVNTQGHHVLGFGPSRNHSDPLTIKPPFLAFPPVFPPTNKPTAGTSSLQAFYSQLSEFLGSGPSFEWFLFAEEFICMEINWHLSLSMCNLIQLYLAVGCVLTVGPTPRAH